MRPILVAVIGAQVAFLTASFLFLTLRRWHDRSERRILERERRALTDGVAAALESPPRLERFSHAVTSVRFDTLVSVLYGFSGRIGGEAWERLVQAVRDTPGLNDTVRRYVRSRLWWRRLLAARALSIVGTSDDLAWAEAVVADPHPAVRLAAISIARRIREERLLAHVLDQAIVSRRVVRGYVFDTLVAARRELAPILERRLRAPSSVFELRDLIRLAGSLATPELLRPVLDLASHDDPEVRGAVARALGSFPHPDSRTALLKLIRDDGWQVRTRAATALGAIGAAEATSLLRDALGDQNWWVRLRAALALRQLGPQGVTQLEAAANDPDRFAREMASYTLGLTDAAVADYLA